MATKNPSADRQSAQDVIRHSEFWFVCDEAGSTGINLLDADQPVHVAAGWLMPDSAAPILRNLVTTFEQARKQLGEVKGARLAKSARGAKGLVALMKEITAAGAQPLFLTWERRFLIAVKVIETFLDSSHNPAALAIPESARSERMRVAQLLYDALPDSHLADFARAYRSPTEEGLNSVLAVIVRDLELLGHERLARIFRANNMREVVAAEAWVGQDLRRNPMAGLNFPAFTNLVRCAEAALPGPPRPRLRVIHDESREFDEAFKGGFELLRSGGADAKAVMDDGFEWQIGIGAESTFEWTRSEVEPLVRAADFLASSVRVASEQALGVGVAEFLRPLVALLFPGLLSDSAGAPGYLGSARFRHGLLAAIASSVKQD